MHVLLFTTEAESREQGNLRVWGGGVFYTAVENEHVFALSFICLGEFLLTRFQVNAETVKDTTPRKQAKPHAECPEAACATAAAGSSSVVFTSMWRCRLFTSHSWFCWPELRHLEASQLGVPSCWGGSFDQPCVNGDCDTLWHNLLACYVTCAVKSAKCIACIFHCS